MAEKDEFFTPEEVDRQIESVSQFKEGDRTDAEVMAYLRSFYRTDTRQEQETLDRVWNRIAHATPSEHYEQEKERYMQDQQTQNSSMGRLRPQGPQRPRRSPLMQRLSILAAAVFLVALVGSLALVFYAVRHNNGGTTSTNPTATLSTARVPLKVTSVTMSVTPGSIADLSCGTNLTVTYTALFHVRPNSAGGTVHFAYTVNNGRGQTPASIHFNPGETTKAYTFTWSGALPIDHTYPQPGGVQVTSPNQLTSSLVGPTGQCTSLAGFHVTNIAMTVSPTSMQGLSCGTSIVVTYTATIHVAPNNSGGTVKFNYTVNNGRGQTPASINFGQGETTKTYAFTWSGALPADHTYPQPGGVQVTSPNQLTSSLVGPTGQCTSMAAFQVTNVAMTVSPTSMQGLSCGTSIVVTYTATIHVAANSPGGTVQFSYTLNNGRGQTPASITFSPGQTVRTYTFTWSGALPADHTYPGPGGIQVTSPNQLTSPSVAPTGMCS